MKQFAAARVAAVLCIMFGWLSLLGALTLAVVIAAQPAQDDDERAARALGALGAILGGVYAWALFVALGSAVTVGLAVLSDLRAWRRPPPP